jgi:hypothetical protein
VSRSEQRGPNLQDDPSKVSPADVVLADRDTGGRDELVVHIQVSYKTLLAVLLIFDIVRRIIEVIFESKMFGL